MATHQQAFGEQGARVNSSSSTEGKSGMSEVQIQPAAPLLVDAKSAACMLAIGRSTFWDWVKKGKAPKPVDANGITRWRVADLQQLVQAMQTTSS
jgi:predicted DNA-binding transcriptional regulator AlpA